MRAQDNPRRNVAAPAAALPGAKAATGLSEVFEALDLILTRIGAHARRRDRQRRAARELGNMSDHALRDIGLHRSEILSVTHNLDRFARFERRRPTRH